MQSGIRQWLTGPVIVSFRVVLPPGRLQSGIQGHVVSAQGKGSSSVPPWEPITFVYQRALSFGVRCWVA